MTSTPNGNATPPLKPTTHWANSLFDGNWKKLLYGEATPPAHTFRSLRATHLSGGNWKNLWFFASGPQGSVTAVVGFLTALVALFAYKINSKTMIVARSNTHLKLWEVYGSEKMNEKMKVVHEVFKTHRNILEGDDWRAKVQNCVNNPSGSGCCELKCDLNRTEDARREWVYFYGQVRMLKDQGLLDDVKRWRVPHYWAMETFLTECRPQVAAHFMFDNKEDGWDDLFEEVEMWKDLAPRPGKSVPKSIYTDSWTYHVAVDDAVYEQDSQ